MTTIEILREAATSGVSIRAVGYNNLKRVPLVLTQPDRL
jgi:hypothetical protein